MNTLVDPTHGGGKFGSYPGFAGPVGTAMLLGALPGMWYRQAFASSRLLPRFLRAPRPRIEPSMRFVRPTTDNVVRDYRRTLRPQFGGRQRGTRFNQKFRPARTTLGDLEREYLKR